MDYRLLGPLEIDDDQGHTLELGGRQQKLVLTMLLLNRNEVVSVDRLIDALWGEQQPSSAVTGPNRLLTPSSASSGAPFVLIEVVVPGLFSSSTCPRYPPRRTRS